MKKFLFIFASGIIGYTMFQKRSSIVNNQLLRNILIAVLMELPIVKTAQSQKS